MPRIKDFIKTTWTGDNNCGIQWFMSNDKCPENIHLRVKSGQFLYLTTRGWKRCRELKPVNISMHPFNRTKIVSKLLKLKLALVGEGKKGRGETGRRIWTESRIIRIRIENIWPWHWAAPEAFHGSWSEQQRQRKHPLGVARATPWGWPYHPETVTKRTSAFTYKSK